MNGYERYVATLRGEELDHLARVPILMAFAAEHIGSDYGKFASDYRVLVEANLRCIEDFGFDQLSAISDPYRETQGFGAQIEYVSDGVPRCIDPPLQSTKDLSVLGEPDPHRSERMLDRLKAIQEFRKEAKGEYSIMGWVEGPAAEAADLRTVIQFMMDVMDDEAFVGELMDVCADVAIEFAQAQLEEGADTIGIGDAIVSQMSPDTYKRLVLPRQQRIVNAIHKSGGIARLHICGDISGHLTAIKDLGADIVDLDWQVDMFRARTILGEDAVIAGNLNPVQDVRDGTPESIRRQIRTVYSAVSNPYIVGAGCEIPPGTPVENLKALCEPVAYEE